MPTKPTWKQLLARSEPLLLPGAHDALSARLMSAPASQPTASAATRWSARAMRCPTSGWSRSAKCPNSTLTNLIGKLTSAAAASTPESGPPAITA